MKRRDSTVSGNSAELQSLKSSDTQVSLQSVGEETPAIDVLIDKFEVPKVSLWCPPISCHLSAFESCESGHPQVRGNSSHHLAEQPLTSRSSCRVLLLQCSHLKMSQIRKNGTSLGQPSGRANVLHSKPCYQVGWPSMPPVSYADSLPSLAPRNILPLQLHWAQAMDCHTGHVPMLLQTALPSADVQQGLVHSNGRCSQPPFMQMCRLPCNSPTVFGAALQAPNVASSPPPEATGLAPKL